MKIVRLGRLLIVDDEVELVTALRDALSERGFEVAAFSDPRDALAALREGQFDALLTDLMMPGMSGIELIGEALALDPNVIPIIMTGQGTVQTAVEAMQIGAFDYVLKPFKISAILPVLSRAVDVRRLRTEVMQLRETVAIHDLCKAITSTIDFETLLHKVADAVMQQCEADEVSIVLPTPDERELYVAVVRGRHTEAILGQRMPISEGVAGWVSQHREPLILHGPVNDKRFHPRVPRAEIVSSICMPMTVGGKFIGVLNVNATRRTRPFTTGEVKAVGIISSVAAPTLESGWMFMQMREAEEKYRGIFEHAIEGIFQTTSDGRYLAANPALARMYGYDSPEELMNAVRDLNRGFYVDPTRRQQFKQALAESDAIHDFESEIYRKDGNVIWIRENARNVRDADGKLLYYEGTTQDITARKHVEEALRESEQTTRTIVETAFDSFISFNSSGFIVAWNSRAEATFGWRRDEVMGRSLADTIISPLNREQHTAGIKRYLETGEGPVLNQRIEIMALHRDGHEFPIELTIWPVRSGDRITFNTFLHDITARKNAEEALRESNRQLQEALEQVHAAQSKILEQERLRALGTMASGVAHDFNNALSPILGFTELLLDNPKVKLQNQDRVIRYLKMINTAGRDAANIVGRLREFYRARERTEVFLPVNLNQIVDQAIALTRPKWRDQAQAAGVSVNVESHPGQIPLIAGNESELREVLTNLIFNAVDAMPEGGAITITTRVGDGENGRQRETAPGSDGVSPTHPLTHSSTQVVLSVCDTGAGMTDEVRKQCLEPFFTTKGEKGTGLGLSMVHGIIRRHDGTVAITSEVDRGTTFSITLPAYKPVRAAIEEVKLQAAATRLLRVLIVDDEDMVRETISAYLSDDGHEVEVATNGAEALQKFHADRFDLVITDRAMPEMGGDQLARTIKQIAPGRPVIMLTGFGEFMQAVGEKPEGVDEVISKPPTLQAVRKAVSMVMAWP